MSGSPPIAAAAIAAARPAPGAAAAPGLIHLQQAGVSFGAQAALLNTANVSGYAGDTVTVVLYEGTASSTSIIGLSGNVNYDSSHLTFQKLVYGSLMSTWGGMEVDDGTGLFIFGISPLGQSNTGVLPDAGSLIGVQFLINAPFPEPLPFTTQVTFSCFDDGSGTGTCLDEPFASVTADVTVLARTTPISTPASLPLAATALTALLFMHLRRQRRSRAVNK